MKKKVMLCAILLSTVMLAGCGKEEPEPIPDTQEIIDVTLSTNIKSPLDMTKEELKALKPEEIKEMVETYLPNYRAVYAIDADRVMTAEDWMSLRDMIVYQLYGDIIDSVHEEIVAGIDWSRPFEIDAGDGSYYDPDWIYYAPCPEYINNLTTAGFARYMNGFMTYNGYVITEDDDFSKRTEEEIEELREMVLADLCKEWGTVHIPSVNELEKAKQDAMIEDIASDADLEEDGVNVPEEGTEDISAPVEE